MRPSRRLYDQPTMTLLRAPERRSRLRRIEDRFGTGLLIFDRETNNLRLFDGSLCCFVGCCDHKVAEAPSLDLGSALHDGKGVRRNARLKARGPGRLLGHEGTSSSYTIHSVRYFTVHYKR